MHEEKHKQQVAATSIQDGSVRACTAHYASLKCDANCKMQPKSAHLLAHALSVNE